MRAFEAGKYPDAVTTVKGESVALGGKEVVRVLPGNAARPETTRRARAATQEELKYLYEIEKHPFIEEVEYTDKVAKD